MLCLKSVCLLKKIPPDDFQTGKTKDAARQFAVDSNSRFFFCFIRFKPRLDGQNLNRANKVISARRKKRVSFTIGAKCNFTYALFNDVTAKLMRWMEKTPFFANTPRKKWVRNMAADCSYIA